MSNVSAGPSKSNATSVEASAPIGAARQVNRVNVRACLMESQKLSRPVAAWSMGGLIWAFGLLSVMSFSVLSDFTFVRGTIFANLDFLTSNILLPLGGFAIVCFAGWFMSRNSTADEIDPEAGSGYRAWRFVARYIAPIAVAMIFLNAIGVF
jgi:NSS family neurotransmitter:Na+ symporter